MINITRKEDCVGCNACTQICPKDCIVMTEDCQGFLYPKVDLDKCINCHLCEKVCPVINQASPREPETVYAAKNLDDKVRRESSSGGVFHALAKKIIEDGGVVFGAKFNDKWEVVHDYTETIEGLKAFQGSKYVQSRIGNTFKIAEEFLKAGRKVMFTGTPCQLAALGLFLRKDYGEQLLKVDVVCHGVPSPLVWREYLDYITRPEGASVGKNTDFQSTLNEKQIPVITGINFRDKRFGWEKFGFSVHAVARKGDQNSDSQSTTRISEEQELLFEPHNENLYMQAFLKDLDLRPSCYACPAKCGKSHSDLTLADYWGIQRHRPDLYEKNGVSLVLSNTAIGQEFLTGLGLNLSDTTYQDALSGNPSIEKSVALPSHSNKMWMAFKDEGIAGISVVIDKIKPSVISRMKSCIKLILKRALRIS